MKFLISVLHGSNPFDRGKMSLNFLTFGLSPMNITA
jgi:hypothetical protein